MNYKFTVYENPFGKQRPRVNKKIGQIYTPRETVVFEKVIEWACRAAMRENGAKMAPPDVPVGMHIDAYFKIPDSWSKKKKERAAAGLVAVTTKPDVDNICKIVMDACNEIVYHDDKQVTMVSVRKLYSTEPHIDVEIFIDAYLTDDMKLSQEE